MQQCMQANDVCSACQGYGRVFPASSSNVMLRPYIACMQLVVVSPLMRTCETAAGVFGGAAPGSPDGELLMKRQDDSHLERSAHDAIALPADMPFVAEELVRERMGEPLLSWPMTPLHSPSAPYMRHRKHTLRVRS